MSRISHLVLLQGCTTGEGWNCLTPDEMERVKELYAEKRRREAM